jgi:hypothetical protein
MISYFFLEKFLVYLGLPSYISYGTDIICLWMLLYLIMQKRATTLVKFAKWPVICVISMLIIAALSVIVNLENSNALWLLWHVRNYYRMIVFWTGCIVWLRPNDIERIMKFFIVMQFANVFMCTIQYFIFGYSGDNLGGVFGVEKGVNGDMNILLCIVAVYAMIKYLNKEINIPACIAIMAGCVYIAALAELKIVFIEIVVIVVSAALIVRPSFKSIGLTIVSIIVLLLGINLLGKAFPKSADFYNLDTLINYANINYGTKTGLSRMNGAQTMYNLFLHTPLQEVFGIGAGNAGTAQFSFLNSNFAKAYEGIFHYTYNYTAMIIIETGLAGIVTNLAFFISNIVEAIKIYKNQATSSEVQAALIFGILTLILIMYNAVFRSEAGYLAYFVLAIPFVYRRVAIDHKARES